MNKNCQVDIVMLSGYKGHGKDSYAEFLIKRFGFKRYAFADKLKEITANMFNVPLKDFYDREKKEIEISYWPYLSPRRISTKFGTDCMRNHFDEDIWVRIGALSIANDIGKQVHWNTSSPMRLRYVITDVRFPNEQKFCNYIIEELKNRNIITRVRLNKIHLIVRRKRFSLWEKIKIYLFDHPSEWNSLFMKYDGEILNFGTLQDLNLIASDLYSHKGWKFAIEEESISS